MALIESPDHPWQDRGLYLTLHLLFLTGGQVERYPAAGAVNGHYRERIHQGCCPSLHVFVALLFVLLYTPEIALLALLCTFLLFR